MSQSIAAVGFPWFRDAAHFALMCAMFEDRDKLHRTYDEWLRAAETGRKSLHAKGARVVRAHLDEHDFPAWCKAEGVKLDSNARTRYASWFAFEVANGRRAEP